MIDGSNRSRRWGPKVRTGCLTCRRRHLKCDESKPSCNRCKKGTLKCDYSLRLGGTTPTVALPLPLSQPAHQVVPSAELPNQQDRELFYVFRMHVVPHMSDIFDKDFWEIVMLQGSQVYRPVWHAALAMSAMNKLLRVGAKKGDHGGALAMALEQRRYYDELALRHCNKSIWFLKNLQHTQLTIADKEMLLLTCILLISYANLRGDHLQAQMHIQGGLYLAKMWRQWQLGYPQSSSSSSSSLSSSSHAATTYRPPNCVTPTVSINMIFRRWEMLMLSSPSNVSEKTIRAYDDEFVQMPDKIPFKSAVEGLYELQPIAIQWRRRVRESQLSEGGINLDLREEAEFMRTPFMTWKAKFHAYQQSFEASSCKGAKIDSDEATRIKLLQIWEHTGEALFMENTKMGPNCWDNHVKSYKAILDKSEALLRNKLRHNTQLEQGAGGSMQSVSSFMPLVGEPLAMVGIICKVPHMRRKAFDLMEAFPFVYGTFDSSFVCKYERIWMKHEEHGSVRLPLPGGCDCIPGSFICNDHRIANVPIRPGKEGAVLIIRNSYEVSHGLPGTEELLPL